MSLPATDTFTGVDGTSPPNANWTNHDNGLAIRTNTCGAATNGAYNFGHWNADSFNNAQYSQARFQDATKTGGVCVRMSGTNNAYMFDCNDGGANYLFSRVGGSYSLIQSLGPASFSASDLCKIVTDDTTKIQCFVDGVQLGTDSNDSSLATGAAGLMAFNANPIWDLWEGGNVGAANTFALTGVAATTTVGTMVASGGDTTAPFASRARLTQAVQRASNF